MPRPRKKDLDELIDEFSVKSASERMEILAALHGAHRAACRLEIREQGKTRASKPSGNQAAVEELGERSAEELLQKNAAAEEGL